MVIKMSKRFLTDGCEGMGRSVSLKEIAERANVSPATVSRVMNKNGRYSKETEERVLRIIDECGYSPNQMARGLRMSRNQIIGIIVPDITNEYFAKLIQVVQNTLFGFDYPVAIYNTNESRDIESKCLRYVRAQDVSGVIYINGDPSLEEGQLDGIPTIYVDREPEKRPRIKTKYVSSDNRAGGYLAASELIRAGCRRVAVMTERAGTYVMSERLAGYAAALEEAGLTVEKELVFRPKAITYEAAYETVTEALEEGVEFDGLFCQTDWLASGAIAALQSRGMKVPAAVRIVGFDNISISHMCSLPFTTVKQDIDAIGAYLANTMIDMIYDRDESGVVQVFPVNLIRRRTT